MIAFLSILLTVLLLGIAVYHLHRQQITEVECSPDRQSPLSSRGEDTLVDGADDDPARELPSGPAAQSPSLHATRTGPQAKKKPRKKKPVNRPGAPSTAAEPRSWLDEVAELKSRGELTAALARCEQEYPLWGAYNQACIILRALIRRAPAASHEEIQLLNRLYQLAATAELLHDKTDAEEPLTLGQMKALDQERLQALEHAYTDIGYAYLRLIRKSDIKLMQARWGRPERHQLPRQYHETLWQQIRSGQRP